MAITQAVGWVAVYREKNGTYFATPIAVWQEYADPQVIADRRNIAPPHRAPSSGPSLSVCGLDGGEFLENVEENENFLGYELATEWRKAYPDEIMEK
jgi:hypothetical protein